ncbi:MAG: hypothetical protein IJD10_06985 [Clostridia bacterium]|nr:hypothetical protein [Clostridia bacterium]
MKNIITYENLRSFTYSNDHLIQGEIKGIVLFFTGLGSQVMYDDDPFHGRYLAERNIVWLMPYSAPWSWMNRRTVDFVDELVDVLVKHYGLPKDLPIVSTGDSMGGLSALTYMAYAERTPVACLPNCPVCDLVYHYTERPDLPRTIYSAFCDREGTLEEVLATASPLHLLEAGKMPQADYHIFHCEADDAVNIDRHSRRFVKAAEGMIPVTLYAVPDRGHCDLGDENHEKLLALSVEAILGK